VGVDGGSEKRYGELIGLLPRQVHRPGVPTGRRLLDATGSRPRRRPIAPQHYNTGLEMQGSRGTGWRQKIRARSLTQYIDPLQGWNAPLPNSALCAPTRAARHQTTRRQPPATTSRYTLTDCHQRPATRSPLAIRQPVASIRRRAGAAQAAENRWGCTSDKVCYGELRLWR
jgi:hypothetical protein